MGKSKRGDWSPLRLARALLTAAAAAGLAWLVIVAGGPRAFPHLAAKISLGEMSPDQLYRRAGEELLSRSNLTPEIYPLLADAARRDPLAQQPFVFFAVRALAGQDVAYAERLLLEARRRAPRDEFTRLLLLSTYLQSNRVADGAREIESLLRIMPSAGELLVPELAKLALNPASRGALLQAIGDAPLMGDVLNQLSQSKADPDLILALAARQPPSRGGKFSPWQISVLDRLAARGQSRRAYELWLRFLGRPEAPGGNVYDSRFEGLPGPPPFNWELASSEAGSAEFVAGPAMEVSYFGRRAGTLAGQTLLLSPGSYSFSIDAEGNAKSSGSRLVWRLQCRESDRTLLEMPLEEVTYAPKRVTGQFAVPGGCGAQRLTLEGIPAEFPEPQSVRFANLEINRGQSAQ